jgi:hypothetical protein
MSVNVPSKGPVDRRRVNVNETWEAQYWCKHFGVTESQLHEAVRTVGVMANHVRAYLDGRAKAAKNYREALVNMKADLSDRG